MLQEASEFTGAEVLAETGNIALVFPNYFIYYISLCLLHDQERSLSTGSKQ